MKQAKELKKIHIEIEALNSYVGDVSVWVFMSTMQSEIKIFQKMEFYHDEESREPLIVVRVEHPL